MNKKVLALLVLSYLSTSAFAYQIIGEGSVSEPEIIHKNGGVENFHVIEQPVTNEQIAEFQKKKKMYGSSMANMNNVSGKVNQHIEVVGNHRVSIANDTSQPSWFKYIYTLTIDGRETKFVRNVDLKPGAQFYDASNSIGDLNKTSPGSYRLSAETNTEGSSAYSHDISYGTATVSK